ncbi:MAG: hypothetical protein FWD36_05360 [Treponema sp.]|nr:hypothetical protein [Treponema sp.]
MKKILGIVSLIAAVLFLTVACLSGPSARSGRGANNQFGSDVYVQKPVIGILPFQGGTGAEGDTVANLFAHQPALIEAFTVVTRTSTGLDIILREQGIAANLSDSNTIASIGRLLNADYVLTGSIRRVGDKNLLIATVVDVNTFEQVAGEYQRYRNLGEATSFMSSMSKNLVNATLGRSTAQRENLAIVPFGHHAGVSAHDSYTLMQILAIELTKTGRYTILPRTSAAEAAKTEQGIQLAGWTEEEGMAAVFSATNAEVVLNGNIGSIGEVNVFIAQILHVRTGSVITGKSINYKAITDGIGLMTEMAILLTETDPLVIEAKIAKHRANEEKREKAEIKVEEKEKKAQEAAVAKAKRAKEAEVRKARMKKTAQDNKSYAFRNELETFSFSYVWIPERPKKDVPSQTGFNFGMFLSGLYFSPLAFTNIGVETGVTAICDGNFFDPSVNPDFFNWHFNISPTIGGLYPLSRSVRIFANAVFDLGCLPGEGAFFHNQISDNFNMGMTPGFNTGFSFGRDGIFVLDYRLVIYKDRLANSVGFGFGKSL